MTQFVIVETTALLPRAWQSLEGPVYAFNPAIATTTSGLLLAYRLCFADGTRRIALCRLDAQLSPVSGSPVPFSDLVLEENPQISSWFADPRLVTIGGTLYVYWNSGVDVRGNRQYLVAISPDTLRPLGRAFDLVLDGPARNIEKNWTFFEAGGLYCLYSAAPFRVLQVSCDGSRFVARDTCDGAPADLASDVTETFRGGAPAVRVDDRLFLFGHSIEKKPDGADYRAELLVLSADPPFTPLARHQGPLPLPNPMGASRRLPPLNPATGSVVYPAGAIRDGDDWIVSYGLNDEAVALARLPQADILPALTTTTACGPRISPDRQSQTFGSTWLSDRFWRDAADWVLKLSRHFRYVLAPHDFNGLVSNCLPLEFSSSVATGDVAIVMPKDDIDRLALACIRSIPTFQVLHVDEVFVVLSARPVDVAEPTTDKERHLPYLLERRERVLAGQSVRRSQIDKRLSDQDAISGTADYGLLICAVFTNNAGDTLMASAAVKFLKTALPRLSWIVAGTDVDRTVVAGARIVVLGPGGFIYDLLEDAVDLQNLANYAKFGFLAGEYQKSFCALGLGHQTIATHAGRKFLMSALADASLITTRDRETADLLCDLGRAAAPIATPDLSFLLDEEVQRAAASAPAATGPTLTLCGEFHNLLVESKSLGALLKRVPGARVRIVIQAQEDAEWIKRLPDRDFAELGSPEIIDVRNAMPATFIHAIARSDALVTTRFHATMLALLAGLPTLVLGRPGDKRERALDALPASLARFVSAAPFDTQKFESACEHLEAGLASRRRRPILGEPGAAALLGSFETARHNIRRMKI